MAKFQEARGLNTDDDVDSLTAKNLAALASDLAIESIAISVVAGVCEAGFKVVERVPLVGPYVQLKYEGEFLTQLLYILASVFGLLVSPLFYAFHLFPTVYNKDLELVLSSISFNTRRLTSVAVFLAMTMFLYAMAGLLFFENVEVCEQPAGSDGTEVCSANAAGRCNSLMQCFISYTYRGFMMSPLESYLPEPTIASDWNGLHLDEGVRLLWEASFTLLTVSMIGAIITGIICDTFAALRDEKDEAVRYRTKVPPPPSPFWCCGRTLGPMMSRFRAHRELGCIHVGV
jgi:hypothetical protein